MAVIERVQGSSWIILGKVPYNWYDKGEPTHGMIDRKGHFGWLSKEHHNNPMYLEIHYDADDPMHNFKAPEAWIIYPNKRKLSKWYNAPYTKAIRLRSRLQKNWDAGSFDLALMAWVARSALYLQDKILKYPDTDHYSGPLAYYPDGQIKGPQVWLQENYLMRDMIAEKQPRYWVPVDLSQGKHK